MTPIDREFLVVLEALEQGVVPSEQAVAELVALGFLVQSEEGIVMTPVARLRLEQLRALAHAADIAALSSAAVLEDSGMTRSG